MLKTIELCLEESCNDIQTVMGYCRLHYIKNWRHLKERESQEQGMTMSEYLVSIEKKFIETKRLAAKEDEPINEQWIENRFDDFDDVSTDESVIEDIMKGLRITIP